MVVTILEFAGVTLGVKVLLGLVLIYNLFPSDGPCAACDGETVPLQNGKGLRALGRACRIERRWCLRCGATMLARKARAPSAAAGGEDAAPLRRAA